LHSRRSARVERAESTQMCGRNLLRAAGVRAGVGFWRESLGCS
jgi:hypothetical protein